MPVTVHQLLVHILDTSHRNEPTQLTDSDRSIIYEHMKTLPELSGSSDLHCAARALVAKLSTLTWQDRELGFKEWKTLADLLDETTS